MIIFNKETIIKRKCAVEAGYVVDTGGPTNHGVTETTANEPQNKKLWPKWNWDGNMKTMPVGLAIDIYGLSWWDKMGLDWLVPHSPILCDRLMDFGINGGRSTAVKALQRILNGFNRNQKDYADIDVDGWIGQNTHDALSAYIEKRGNGGLDNLVIFHIGEQTHHYLTISNANPAKYEEYTNGWANRVDNDLKLYRQYLNQLDGIG